MENVINPRTGASRLTWVAFVLVLIGAINWGLIGLFGFDLVAAIFGSMSAVSRIIYVLVGVSGLYLAVIAARTREPTRIRS
jgi:uncharacterized protein